MKISYGVYKEDLDDDKGLRYQIVYLIDGRIAAQSAKKALQESLEEAKIATDYIEQVSKGIDAINFQQTGLIQADETPIALPYLPLVCECRPFTNTESPSTMGRR